MAEPLTQLPLPVLLQDEATFANFLCFGELESLKLAVETSPAAGGEHFLYLHGSEGSGRSHFLQAACHALPAGASLYLPLEQLQELPPEALLDSVDKMQLVCLDNIDTVLGEPAWENALFNLCHQVRHGEGRLLISANCAPVHLPVQLPDLQSRLAWGLVMHMPNADDDEKQQLLQFRAARRGLEISEDLGFYILSRSGRSIPGLMAVLDRLDRASLVEKRALTKPFIKSVMDW